MKLKGRVRGKSRQIASTERRIFVPETAMKDAEALTRKLFENQTLYVPATDEAAYRLQSQLQQTDANVVIVSRLDNEKDKAEQQEIFNRMLSRLPDPTLTTKVIYTDKTTVDVNVFSALTQTQRILLCGVELRHGETVFPLNKNISRDRMQLLPVTDIAFIDLDPPLKKTMWLEWMKQFSQ